MATEPVGTAMAAAPGTLASLVNPYLERYPEPGGPPERVSLAAVPFTVGRAESADFTIYSNVVSKTHAVVISVGDRYAIRDLQSTNGTFVNGRRVVEQALADGDIVHFAQIEFCFRCPTAADYSSPTGESDPGILGTQALRLAPPVSLIRSTEMLRDLIRLEAIETVLQPIVDLHTSEVVGVEALARGAYPTLSSKPAELLALAEQCGMAIELSQLLRRLAVQATQGLPTSAKLFLNVHPRELGDFGLIESVVALAPWRKKHPLVIEIPESAVTDVGAMRDLGAALSDLDVEFAYDDFGAGQTRLLEMTAVPPHYLKFDKTMIQGIETAKARQEMVAAIVKVADTLGVRTIAEGIETTATAAVCRKLGCHLGQGYLLCPPTGTFPRDSLTTPTDAPSTETPRGLKRK